MSTCRNSLTKLSSSYPVFQGDHLQFPSKCDHNVCEMFVGRIFNFNHILLYFVRRYGDNFYGASEGPHIDLTREDCSHPSNLVHLDDLDNGKDVA